MAKSEKRIRHTLAVQNDAIGHQLEQSVTSDDNLLPDAEEVERYYAMDPDILSCGSKKKQHVNRISATGSSLNERT